MNIQTNLLSQINDAYTKFTKEKVANNPQLDSKQKLEMLYKQASEFRNVAKMQITNHDEILSSKCFTEFLDVFSQEKPQSNHNAFIQLGLAYVVCKIIAIATPLYPSNEALSIDASKVQKDITFYEEKISEFNEENSKQKNLAPQKKSKGFFGFLFSKKASTQEILQKGNNDLLVKYQQELNSCKKQQEEYETAKNLLKERGKFFVIQREIAQEMFKNLQTLESSYSLKNEAWSRMILFKTEMLAHAWHAIPDIDKGMKKSSDDQWYIINGVEKFGSYGEINDKEVFLEGSTPELDNDTKLKLDIHKALISAHQKAITFHKEKSNLLEQAYHHYQLSLISSGSESKEQLSKAKEVFGSYDESIYDEKTHFIQKMYDLKKLKEELSKK